jgi:hypothetical protein
VAGGIFSAVLSSGQVIKIDDQGLHIETNTVIPLPNYFIGYLNSVGTQLPTAVVLPVIAKRRIGSRFFRRGPKAIEMEKVEKVEIVAA